MLSEEAKSKVQEIREQLKEGKVARLQGANPDAFGTVTWYLVYNDGGYEGKNLQNGINDRISDEDLEEAYDAYTFDGQGEVSVISVDEAPKEIREWAVEWGENVEDIGQNIKQSGENAE